MQEDKKKAGYTSEYAHGEMSKAMNGGAKKPKTTMGNISARREIRQDVEAKQKRMKAGETVKVNVGTKNKPSYEYRKLPKQK